MARPISGGLSIRNSTSSSARRRCRCALARPYRSRAVSVPAGSVTAGRWRRCRSTAQQMRPEASDWCPAGQRPQRLTGGVAVQRVAARGHVAAIIAASGTARPRWLPDAVTAVSGPDAGTVRVSPVPPRWTVMNGGNARPSFSRVVRAGNGTVPGWAVAPGAAAGRSAAGGPGPWSAGGLRGAACRPARRGSGAGVQSFRW